MKIAVLLSTYNGGSYLKYQLDSLIHQELKNFIVYLRDDGSSDNTIEIIKEYEKSFPTKIVYIDDLFSHLGPAQSFMKLLSEVDADYYFFCDQDDVWKVDKMSRSMELMIEIEKMHPNKPVLIHTDAEIVDQNLSQLYPSLWQHSKVHPSRLDNKRMLPVCYTVTGCTSVINRMAKIISVDMPSGALMHDSWIAYCVSQKGIVKPLYYSSMLYRQHAQNVFGIVGTGKRFNTNKLKELKETINEYKKLAKFYSDNGYGSTFKWYFYKLVFFLIR